MIYESTHHAVLPRGHDLQDTECVVYGTLVNVLLAQLASHKIEGGVCAQCRRAGHCRNF